MVFGLASHVYEERWACSPWRRGDIRQTCTWCIKSCMVDEA